MHQTQFPDSPNRYREIRWMHYRQATADVTVCSALCNRRLYSAIRTTIIVRSGFLFPCAPKVYLSKQFL